MISSSVAGIVFANAHDETIERLTKKRSIASVPFGGRYRLIDFCLSNLVNAGVSNIGIITKEKYRSLMDHLGSGMHWDLDRKSGGIRILPPYNVSRVRLYQNHVEALYGAMDFMVRCNAKHIVVYDARTVANINISEVIKTHTSNNADITVVCRRGLEITNGDNTMALDVGKDGRVLLTGFPAKIAADDCRSMGVYVFDREKLIDIVKKSYETGGDTINDDLISANLGTLKVMAYEHKGYAAIMDCPKAYRRANFELLNADVRKDLFNRERPIYTKTRDDMPTRYGTQSSVTNSLVAEGCVIEGTVKNSVLFRGVKVEKGAVVENSILMQGVTVNENAQLDKVVSDKNATVNAGMVIKGTDEQAFFVEKNQTL